MAIFISPSLSEGSDRTPPKHRHPKQGIEPERRLPQPKISPNQAPQQLSRKPLAIERTLNRDLNQHARCDCNEHEPQRNNDAPARNVRATEQSQRDERKRNDQSSLWKHEHLPADRKST